MIDQTFNPVAVLVMYAGARTTQENAEIETQSLETEKKIRKRSN